MKAIPAVKFEHGITREKRVVDWVPSAEGCSVPGWAVRKSPHGKYVVRYKYCHDKRWCVGRAETVQKAQALYKQAHREAEAWRAECRAKNNYGLPHCIKWVKPKGVYSIRLGVGAPGGRRRIRQTVATRREALAIYDAVRAAGNTPHMAR